MTYEERVRQLEEEGCTTSDAQSVADCEVLDHKLPPPGGNYILHEAFQRIYAEHLRETPKP
jgi:hypothetical protein